MAYENIDLNIIKAILNLLLIQLLYAFEYIDRSRTYDIMLMSFPTYNHSYSYKFLENKIIRNCNRAKVAKLSSKINSATKILNTI